MVIARSPVTRNLDAVVSEAFAHQRDSLAVWWRAAADEVYAVSDARLFRPKTVISVAGPREMIYRKKIFDKAMGPQSCYRIIAV